MAAELTVRQQQVFDYVTGYIGENGVSPTNRQIAKHIGGVHPNSVGEILRRLAAKGLLYIKPKAARGIRLVGQACSEVGEYFTLFAPSCMHLGCGRTPELFGYCKEHYAEEIDRRFLELQRKGKTRPTPKCFEERQWVEYQVHTLDSPTPVRKGYVNPCEDCTPERKRQMRSEKRCEHGETIFIVRNGREPNDIEGINSDTYRTWEKACQGSMGVVVQMPPIEERIAAVERHQKELGNGTGSDEQQG